MARPGDGRTGVEEESEGTSREEALTKAGWRLGCAAPLEGRYGHHG